MVQRGANLTAAKRFLREALKRHRRPERIVIERSRTNRGAIISSDTTDHLQVRSRRELKPSGIYRSRYSTIGSSKIIGSFERRVRPLIVALDGVHIRAVPGIQTRHFEVTAVRATVGVR